MQIPVYRDGKIIACPNFTPNLDLISAPSYLNESCSMGLVRLSNAKDPMYEGLLAVLYMHEFYPSQNRGELISENDAWVLCQNRGKVELIQQLGITYEVKKI